MWLTLAVAFLTVVLLIAGCAGDRHAEACEPRLVADPVREATRDVLPPSGRHRRPSYAPIARVPLDGAADEH